VATFIVGFILNARLTGILMGAVIPSMTIVVLTGTTLLNRHSKRASESTTAASAIASGAIKAVQVVQAFDAFGPLVAEHENNLKQAMAHGMKKSITGAVLLGSVFFIALVMISSVW
jgi:ATP-binding cassette subfamily B (MDR/TAP) protein 1